MNEFIKKLIERLEEEKSLVPYNRILDTIEEKPKEIAQIMTYQRTIEIVKQLAEEYSENIMIDGQYCWQTCACVEKCKECSRLCNGDIDWYENIEDWND